VEVKEINLDDIYIPDEVLREYGDPTALEELKQSIREYGLLHPIVVVKQEKGYRLVAGLRRCIAVKQMGWEKIPAHVLTESDEDILDLITLEENIKREDISPVQEGRWFKRLMSKGITMREIAEKIGKSLAYVQQRVELTEAEYDLQQAVEEGKISFTVAREIMGIKNPRHREYIKHLAMTTGANSEQVIAWKKSLEEDEKTRTYSASDLYYVSQPEPSKEPTTICPMCKREYPLGTGIAIVFCPDCYRIVVESLRGGGEGDDSEEENR